MERRELIKRWMAWKTDSDGEKYTYRALAADAGLNPNYLSNIMTGIRNPGVKSLNRIAAAFGVTLSDFFAGPDAQGNGNGCLDSDIKNGESAAISGTAFHDDGLQEPEESPAVASGDKSEKFGLKVSGDGKDDFDRLVSSFGFNSTDFITPDGGIAHNGNMDEPRRSAASVNPEPVRASQSIERNGDQLDLVVPEASEIPGPRLPILDDERIDDLSGWLDGFRKDENAYESLPRMFEIEGERVFAYRVEDDSMAHEILQGDYLFIDPDAAFDSMEGHVVMAIHDGTVFIRRVFDHGDSLLLVPTNSYYEQVEIDKNSAMLMKIVLWLPQRDEMF